MTAEIAILNRTAVALAADSIVTLASPKSAKTYDSAEKIFQLSRYQPIGLMIYNNALFMNAPLEVLVRRFRETVTSVGYEKLVQIWPAFENFLLQFKRDKEDEREHFEGMLSSQLKQFADALFNQLLENALAGRRRGKRTTVDPGALLVRLIKERTQVAKGKKLDPPFLEDIKTAQLVVEYGQALEKAAKERFAPLGIDVSSALIDSLGEMMLEILRSTQRSAAYTGLVFAGFGTEELFPTLYALEIDGVYFDRLRTMNVKIVDIDRRGETSAVVPFAQKDMPERFIFGIDRTFETSLGKLADSMVSDVVKQAGAAFDKDQAELIREAAASQFRTGIGELKRNSSQALDTVVNHMSKKELGEVAFSLVELTSRKRRYSTDMETVGGPIDVAILTRNEGLVWVRRKHYFDAEINPQYSPR